MLVSTCKRFGATGQAKDVRSAVGKGRSRKAGRVLLLHLTLKGEKYHQGLIHHRRSADEKTRQLLAADERATLIRQLKRIAEMEF